MDSIWRQRVQTGSHLVVLSVCVCMSGAAMGGEWSFVPHVNINQQYTDNVTLTSQETLQDYITSINSGVAVRGTSARLDSTIDYNAQRQIYDSEDEFSGLNNQLQARNSLTVIDQFLYFEINSTISQQSIDNTQTLGIENRTQAGNETDVTYYEFIPSVQHRFGSWAEFYGIWVNGTTSTSGGNINSRGSGDNESLDLRLSTGARFARMPITLSYSRNEETFDSGSGNEQERYNAAISYILSRKIKLDFEIGSEDNSSSNSGQNGGNNRGSQLTWSIGGTLNPSPRTEIHADFGERGFGSSNNFSFSHRMRRFIFNANYRETINTRSNELRELVLVPTEDAFGNPIFDPDANSNILNPVDLASINESSFESQSFKASATYAGRLTSGTVSYFESNRTDSGSSTETTTRGVQSSINRSLSRRLSISMRALWRENLTESTENNSTFLITPGISYTAGPHTDLRVNYTYRIGDGPKLDDNYYENVLSASVTFYY